MSILIKNARIIDPSQKMDKKGDILIEDGKIAKGGGSISKKAEIEIDAGGKIASPGFIDMHTHVREPGREEVETIETASMAAAAGGFTTISAMPNTTPSCDSMAEAKYIIDRAREVGLANVLPIGSITKGREGEEITEMDELKEAGSPAVSDDGSSVKDAALMRRALEYASMEEVLVISHAEEESLSEGGVMHEGYWSTVLGLAPIPAEAESTIVERDIALAQLAGARLHIAHVSCAESVRLIREGKKKGALVTAEVTPHHLQFTDEELKTYDTALKVNPPLRSKEDLEEIKKGIKDGTIDVIATDHAPHLENEKEKEFNYAPFGMIGLETALPVAAGTLIEGGILKWPDLIRMLTKSPAEILRIDKGTLKEGSAADVVIIDPDAEWTYLKEEIKSKATNSPFIGKKMKGKVTHTIHDGTIIVKEGELQKE